MAIEMDRIMVEMATLMLNPEYEIKDKNYFKIFISENREFGLNEYLREYLCSIIDQLKYLYSCAEGSIEPDKEINGVGALIGKFMSFRTKQWKFEFLTVKEFKERIKDEYDREISENNGDYKAYISQNGHMCLYHYGSSSSVMYKTTMEMVICVSLDE